MEHNVCFRKKLSYQKKFLWKNSPNQIYDLNTRQRSKFLFITGKRAQSHLSALCSMFASKEMPTNHKIVLPMAQIYEIILIFEFCKNFE